MGINQWEMIPLGSDKKPDLFLWPKTKQNCRISYWDALDPQKCTKKASYKIGLF